MLTAGDKKWFQEQLAHFATKKELGAVRDSVDLLRQKLITFNLEKFDLDNRIRSLEAASFRTEEKIDKVLTQMDGFTGRVADLDQENKMGAITLRRHSVNIEELAKATSTTISK